MKFLDHKLLFDKSFKLPFLLKCRAEKALIEGDKLFYGIDIETRDLLYLPKDGLRFLLVAGLASGKSSFAKQIITQLLWKRPKSITLVFGTL